MTTPAQRLKELNLELPAVAPPVAAYVPAVRDGDYIYTSGQLPFVDGELLYTGLVGPGVGTVTPEQANEAARVCVLNAIAAAAEHTGGIDGIERIIKLTGFVASAVNPVGGRFTAQPGVINGGSELLGEIFGSAGEHARSAVGVAALPLDAPVEIELIVKARAGA